MKPSAPSVALVFEMSICAFCGPGCVMEPSAPSVAPAGTINGVTPWQKRARLLMALVAIGVIAAVAYTLRPREAAAPPQPIEKLAAGTQLVTIGGNAIQLKGASQDLKIEFERQETYKDGQTRLFGVKVLASNRSGRDFDHHRQRSAGRQGRELVRDRGRRQARDERRSGGPQRGGDLLGRRKDRARARAGEVLARPHERHRRRVHLRRAARHPDHPRKSGRPLRPGREGRPHGRHRRHVHLRAARPLHALRAHDAHGSRRTADGCGRRHRAAVPRPRRNRSHRAARQLPRHRRRADGPRAEHVVARHQPEIRRRRPHAAECRARRPRRGRPGDQQRRRGPAPGQRIHGVRPGPGRQRAQPQRA